jgi:hypothetical protein
LGKLRYSKLPGAQGRIILRTRPAAQGARTDLSAKSGEVGGKETVRRDLMSGSNGPPDSDELVEDEINDGSNGPPDSDEPEVDESPEEPEPPLFPL